MYLNFPFFKGKFLFYKKYYICINAIKFMSICIDGSCGLNPFRYTGYNCNTVKRQGGIKHLVFAHCTVSFKDYYDLSEWCEYIYKGKVTLTGYLTADKPASEALTTKLHYCNPENYTGSLRVLNFTDYLSDISFSDFDFWNFLLKNYHNYKFGFITCDDYFTGFIDHFDLNVSRDIEQASSDLSYWRGSIKWYGYYEPMPLYIDNLITVLMGDCSKVPGFNKCINDIVIVNRTGRYSACNPDERFVFEALPLLRGAEYIWKDQLNNVLLQGVDKNLISVAGAGVYSVIINKSGCPPVELSVEILQDSLTPTIINIVKMTISPGVYAVSVTGINPCAPYGGRQVRVFSISANTYTDWVDGFLVTNLSAGAYFVEIRCKNRPFCYSRSSNFNLP